MSWSRRKLLRAGGGLLSFGGLVGLGGISRIAHAATERHLLVYWNAGGWDPTFVFDPKIGNNNVDSDSSGTESEVGGLTFVDSDSRPSVRSFLESHSAQTCFVNGISVGSISHDLCTRLMLTGSRALTAPDLPTRLAAATAGALAMPHVVVSGPRYPGDLGEVQVPLSPTLTGTVQGDLPAGVGYSAETEARARDYLQAVASAETQSDAIAQYIDGLDRLAELEALGSALTVPESATSEELLTAGIEVLSQGLSRCVMVEGSMPERFLWDSHVNNAAAQDACFENLFDALSSLMETLASASGPGGGSLLDTTMVLVLSEMGRTPIENAGSGKDHWPTTSAMLVGAGVAGGQVVGATDDTLTGEKVDLTTGEATDGGQTLTAAHLLAGVLAGFDVDPGASFEDVDPLLAPFESV